MIGDWEGPYQVVKLLEGCITGDPRPPPEADGIYVVSKSHWVGEPATSCEPLYVGSNTGRSARFRTRIGDLVADLFGFFGEETGHHSGGQHLFHHCREHQIPPLELYIGWVKTTCARCDENLLFDQLQPLLNRTRPSRCKEHG